MDSVEYTVPLRAPQAPTELENDQGNGCAEEVGREVQAACYAGGDKELVQFVGSCVDSGEEKGNKQASTRRLPCQSEEHGELGSVEQLVEVGERRFADGHRRMGYGENRRGIDEQ